MMQVIINQIQHLLRSSMLLLWPGYRCSLRKRYKNIHTRKQIRKLIPGFVHCVNITHNRHSDSAIISESHNYLYSDWIEPRFAAIRWQVNYLATTRHVHAYKRIIYLFTSLFSTHNRHLHYAFRQNTNNK